MRIFLIVTMIVLLFFCGCTKRDCPVVGNTQSKIYHLPHGVFYNRMMKVNRDYDNRKCFQDEESAIENGYRKSKI
jgi:hypothetical protein